MNDLDELFRIEIEEVFGRAGTIQEPERKALELAKSWEGKKVIKRCVEYLENHPLLTYIDTGFRSFYSEMLKNSPDVLEVGCFLGNEGRKLLEGGFKGRYVGIDINPYHMLVGFLLHNDSPDRYVPHGRFEIGDACNMRLQDSRFDFVYSPGLIHSLGHENFEEKVKAHLKEVRRVLKAGGKYFGNTYSSREWVDTALVPTPISKQELDTLFENANLQVIESRELRISSRADVGRNFLLYFQAVKD